MDWGCMSFASSERRWACNIRICARSGSAESDMYQLYHGITDTKQPFPPFLNEFFFGGFLKHRTTMSYGTFATSGVLQAGPSGHRRVCLSLLDGGHDATTARERQPVPAPQIGYLPQRRPP